MSPPYALPTLVKGPYELPERCLVVNVGWLAVILRNGVPRRVCGPGRHSAGMGFLTGRRLPATGELSVLFFDNAPHVLEMSAEAVLLADARRVGVRAVAVVQPAWGTDPGALLDIVAHYGVLSARYGDAAGLELDADFRAWTRTLLRERGHDDVYLAADGRSALAALPGGPGVSATPGEGLLAVERFVDVVVTPDPVVVAIEQVRDGTDIRRAEYQAKAALAPLADGLRQLEAALADSLTEKRELRRARLDADLGAVYGVIPLFLRDPDAAAEVMKTRWQSLSGLIGEYADVLPFLAEQLGVSQTELLQDLAQGRVPHMPGPDVGLASPERRGELDERRRGA